MGSTQEVTVDTAAGTGDQTTGGVRVNYRPAGRAEHLPASIFATGANSSFQGDNMTPELVARGLRQPNSLKQTYDVNPTGGGPIVRDKLWFYSAARFQTQPRTTWRASSTTRTRGMRTRGSTSRT